ncbi:MAG: response regulator [Polyangiales bacterium]
MPDLLWVDDDGPHRFKYEEVVLREDHGWQITWSRSIEGAIDALATRRFDAIVLDQMLPLADDSAAAGYWGGYALLHWLKGCKEPTPQPPPEHARRFVGKTPHPGNAEARVCIVSAFEDLTVQKAIRTVCPQIAIFPKPLELERLEEFLAAQEPERARDTP